MHSPVYTDQQSGKFKNPYKLNFCSKRALKIAHDNHQGPVPIFLTPLPCLFFVRALLAGHRVPIIDILGLIFQALLFFFPLTFSLCCFPNQSLWPVPSTWGCLSTFSSCPLRLEASFFFFFFF